MRISVYTYLRNGLFLDFHALEMLTHHLPLADEIVINEGYSDDGTYEAIKDLSPKIKIYRHDWNSLPKGPQWYCALSDQARSRCTGDWCVKLDTDEFIPEWEFDRLRAMVEHTDQDLFPLKFTNFYANYKVLIAQPGKLRWPEWKMAIHRNLDIVRAVGDGSSVMVGDARWAEVPDTAIQVHHFGAVRNPARLRQKWREQVAINAGSSGIRKFRIPSLVYNLAPHNWLDEDLLKYSEIYPGPYVKAVRDNPDEFTRDSMKVFEHLRRQPAHEQAAAREGKADGRS